MEMIPKGIASALATAFENAESEKGRKRDDIRFKPEFEHTYKKTSTVYTLNMKPEGRDAIRTDFIIDVIETYDRYRLLEVRDVKKFEVVEYDCPAEPDSPMYHRGCAMPDPPKPVGHVAIQSDNIDIILRMAEYRCS